MNDLSDRLISIETRLHRCLADGWRTSEADRPALQAEADEIAQAGLIEYAARLEAVVDASSPSHALAAITLALASSRLLRARLGGVDRHGQPWTPWVVPRKSRSTERETIWPLCRFSLGDTIVWSCLRSRGYPVEWVLIEEAPDGDSAPWYGVPLVGHLQWRGRLPVGHDREVQIAVLRRVRDDADAPTGPDVYQAIRRRLAVGKLREDKLPAWGGGSMRLMMLERDDLDLCHWPDAIVGEHFSALLSDHCWTLVWEAGDVRVPIGAIVERGRVVKKLHVVHLIPDCPSLELDALT